LNILVFHTGSLGDTLISVPALWGIREHFKSARISLLCNKQINEHVSPYEILNGSGLIDDYLTYQSEVGFYSKYRLPGNMLELYPVLRQKRFDALVYLIRRGRKPLAVMRDLTFFRLAGIRCFYAHRGFQTPPKKQLGQSLPAIAHQTDQILSRLALSGIPVSPPGCGKMDLGVSDSERESVDKWLLGRSGDGGRQWIAVGPGSKMPAKVWPRERYAEVVEAMIEKHDIWPVVFGGPEDRQLGEELVKNWGRGYVAAGYLNIRQGVGALQRCLFYLGNDTGTMHMAVAAGIPCVAVFSARDYPGNWYPYGKQHIVIREEIDCEGCMLEACVNRGNECLLSVSTEIVYEAARKMLTYAACQLR
jgi:ADP-heptose:LPS heptosyltransferase